MPFCTNSVVYHIFVRMNQNIMGSSTTIFNVALTFAFCHACTVFQHQIKP